MPLYEYQCTNGHTHIETRSIHDDQEPTTCTECQQPLTQKLGTIGVTFKGSGFYSTDK
jgi:putative FmdB family regulatory protein